MKTIIVVMLLGLTGSAVAQGTVNFADDSSSLIQLSPFSGLPSEPITGGYAQFFWAPSNYGPPTPLLANISGGEWLVQNAAWSLAGVPTSIGPTPGIFDGGTVTISGVSPGTTIRAVVIGWRDGPTFPSSIDHAVSASFLIQLGDPSGTPSIITGPGGFSGLTITMIPESPTAGLMELGLLVLLCCQRRGSAAAKRCENYQLMTVTGSKPRYSQVRKLAEELGNS